MRISKKWIPSIAVPAVIAAGAVAVPLQANAVDLPDLSANEVMVLMQQSEVQSFSGTIVKVSDMGLPTLEFSSMVSEEMVAEMHRHGYPLQAVLYLVALRRYLRLRHLEADVDDLIVGAAYLFVRGMDPIRSHDDTRGVVWWCPPAAVIAQLDTIIESGVGR